MYLCYDLKGIQSFIFQVPQLRYIIGGSAIIDRFDRKFVKGLVEEEQWPKEAELLFSGGGRGAFFIDGTDAEKVRNLADKVQERLVGRAYEDGLTICFGRDAKFTEAAHAAVRTFPWVPKEKDLDGQPCSASGLYPTSTKIHPMVENRAKLRSYFAERLLSVEHWLPKSLDEDNKYPMNASCASCGKDKTAKEKLLKCSGCKFTHYW